MAFQITGFARLFFYISLLIDIPIYGLNIDSLLQGNDIQNLAQYLDELDQSNKQILRFRYADFEFDNSLKLNLPGGIEIKHRDKIYFDKEQESQSSFEWT